MNISADKYKELLHVAECLSYGLDSAEIRTAVGDSLIRLLDADFYASYVWSGKDRKFSDGVSINMDKKNLSQYDDYYQFHDPITHQLQRRQRATLVNEIMPQDELIQTEFYNDFLSTDGLYWGINLYAFDGRDNIGDIRIWRKKSASNFDDTSLQLLQMIHPHFTNSLRSIKRLDEALEPDVEKVGPTVTASWDADLIEKEFGFTQREAQIVREILRGKKDDEIADALCIAFSTLRTHINHIFDKANVRNRSSLCHKVLNKITGFC